MTDLPPPEGNDAWRAFAAAWDAFQGHPRCDHGLPVDPPGLGGLILEQHDLSAGALGLRHRLIEQLGPQAGHEVWIGAWEWIRDQRRAQASAQLEESIDQLIAALRSGTGIEERLADTGATLEELDPPEGTGPTQE